MNKNAIIGVLVAGVSLGIGFFGGMKFQQNKDMATRSAFIAGRLGVNGNRMGNFDSGQRNGGFRPVSGEILSNENSTLTVKLADGSSKLISFSDATTIYKSETGKISDLVKGAKINVFGNETSSGTITATNISVGDFQFRMMGSQPK